MLRLGDIPTPALIVDRGVLLENAAAMATKMKECGVVLRTHLKTAKSVDIAHIAFGGTTGPITVSTLCEASYFAGHGFHDIIYAVGIVPNKLDAVADLIRAGVDLKLVLDDADLARSVAAEGRKRQTEFPVLVEIDCDGHRSGIEADDTAALLTIGKILHEERGVALRGVLTHAGASYTSKTTDDIRRWAHQERQSVVTAARRLTDVGLPCPIVSVGSTPTAVFGTDLTGITEVRAGTYLFNDLFQVGLGVCEESNIALSVLTTVIGHSRKYNRLITDAGMLALSLDHSTATQKHDRGFGAVCDPVSRAVMPGYVVADLNQEHGIVCGVDIEVDFDALQIGSRLRILPNHACTTAAAHDKYFVVDGSDEVVCQWYRVNGWELNDPGNTGCAVGTQQ